MFPVAQSVGGGAPLGPFGQVPGGPVPIPGGEPPSGNQSLIQLLLAHLANGGLPGAAPGIHFFPHMPPGGEFLHRPVDIPPSQFPHPGQHGLLGEPRMQNHLQELINRLQGHQRLDQLDAFTPRHVESRSSMAAHAARKAMLAAKSGRQAGY